MIKTTHKKQPTFQLDVYEQELEDNFEKSTFLAPKEIIHMTKILQNAAKKYCSSNTRQQ
jgi:hypothetical protein